MAFKMKGISSLTTNKSNKQIVKSNSPLFNTDPSGKSFSEMQIEVTDPDLSKLDYVTTQSARNQAGKNIALEGKAVIPGKKVEKQLVPEDFEGGKNNPEYQKKLAALEIAMEQGKDAKYKQKTVERVRKLSNESNVRMYPNPNTKPGGFGKNFTKSKKKQVTFAEAKKSILDAYKHDPAQAKRAVKAWAKTNNINLVPKGSLPKNKKKNTRKNKETLGNYKYKITS